jgi:(1->4)-alpha-D-glucan 1-alpha-D-glucosylmutase
MMPDRPTRSPFRPVSTYRLQVYGSFTLDDAAAVVPYLARLGVTACYTSPYFTAAPGSTHGYDVCDHNEINPELGGESAHRRFIDAVHRSGLGHVVDFVPNHMGIGSGNAWWRGVLENGPSSPTARYFDIDWTPIKAELQAKLHLPILGDQYGRVLERGELQLEYRDGALTLKYFEHELPVNPRQAPRVFRLAVEPLTGELDQLHLNEFLSILASLENMPAYTALDPERIAERQREKEVARARLVRLVEDAPAVGRAIAAAVRVVNGEAGRAESFDALHALLEAQAYRLAYWRTASHEINYRRFFDINTLAGIRVEDEEVFAATHALLGRLLADGSVDAVRIDHPDGLFDPKRYFEMLQGLAADARGAGPAAGPEERLYVVAEKILSGREKLPSSWPVAGTTGYNFLNDLNGLFIDASQARQLRRIYVKLTGHLEPFDEVLYESKSLIMLTAMASELNVLAHKLDRIAESNRKSRDFTLDSLRDVIREVVACFPVYRTYVDDRGWAAEDREVVERAITRARRRNPAMESSIFDFFREVVLPRDPDDGGAAPGPERRGGYPPADASEARERLSFAMKLQQYTGPVQAKGLEDTAFYRYNVLLTVNEVGGDPDQLGRSVGNFHDTNRHRASTWPSEMLGTSTHDTKLGEDVRARINIISEIPDQWGREVGRWMRINRAQRRLVDGEPAPDRTDEYRLYQVLIGAWPVDLGDDLRQAPPEFIERMSAYMLKSVREAKVHTSWLTTNQAYEEALTGFVDRILGSAGGPKFLPAFLPFERRVASLSLMNSLSQVVLKIASPGVPDFYQGTELWDLSLVDPDNRRPVDFDLRARLLDGIESANPAELLEHWRDGRVKLFVTTRGLHLRRELPQVFVGGEYLPLEVDTSVPGDAVAFARQAGDECVIAIAPRLCARMVLPERPLPLGGEAWKTSRVLLPESLRHRTFTNVFTGEEIRPTTTAEHVWIFLGQALERLPVALLRSR